MTILETASDIELARPSHGPSARPGTTPPTRPPASPPVPLPDRPARPPRRRRLRTVAIIIVALLIPVGWSYAGYLTAAGDAPVSVRTVDWMRDHGFQSVVNNVEQWWYTRNKPTGSKPLRSDLPTPPPPTAAKARLVETTRVVAPIREGVWSNVVGLAVPDGNVQQTYLRPAPNFPSVVADVVRFDQRSTRLVYVPGLKDPGGSWAWGARIPAARRSSVMAAFNAGFKFRDTRGGIYTEGRHAVRALAPGLASIVIHRDGTADVADWGRDATLTPDVVSVRQNLALIVDHGVAAAGLTSDRGGWWGNRKSQYQLTWRSAAGVDAQGRLIYAAGRQMSLNDLANTMIKAGAVRAMQLDIHDGVVSFNWFRSDAAAPDGINASKLTESMQRDATRFLVPDQRDFFAVTAR